MRPLQLLDHLVAWSAPAETPVLSLYLDTSPGTWADAAEQARDAVEELLETHPWASDEFAAAARARLEGLDEEVAAAWEEGCDGLALFYSAEPPLDARLRLRRPVEDTALLGRDPFLKNLLLIAEEYEPVLVAVLGPEGVRLAEVELADLVDERPVVEADAATHIARRLLDEPRLHLLILGEPPRREALEADLDEALRARIIDRLDADPSPHHADFLPLVHRAQQRYERRSEEAGVAGLLRSHEAGGPATVGVEDTLEALRLGKIQVLYTVADLAGTGWLCDDCDRLGALPAPPGCLSCGATVSEVPLEEHLYDQAAAAGAEIETVAESPDLAAVGGVGAMLGPAPGRHGP